MVIINLSISEMIAELLPIDGTLKTKEKPFSFAIENRFSHGHRFKLVVEDK